MLFWGEQTGKTGRGGWGIKGGKDALGQHEKMNPNTLEKRIEGTLGDAMLQKAQLSAKAKSR